MPLAIVQKSSNYGYNNYGFRALRDFSEPLQQEKVDPSGYSQRILSTLDFSEMVPELWDLERKRVSYIKMFRQMAKNPYIDFSIEDILSEMLAFDDDTVYPVALDLSNVESLSENIKNKIHTEFKFILKKLSYHKKAYTYLRNFYIDGTIMFFVSFEKNKNGITDIIELDPIRVKKVTEMDNKTGESFTKYFYLDIDLSQSLYEIPQENIIETNSGLMDDQGLVWVSNLYKAYIPLNQLCSIEDALVIYRITRAPQRRVFYVDVGELPKSKAEAYMKELIRNYRNNMQYDKETGTIKEQVRHTSLLDDIWLPRRSGSNGTTVDTLEGNTSFLQNLDDLDYFLRKLFHSLNVPFSRFTDSENRTIIGRNTEITRDELKYTKFINRIRSQFNSCLYSILTIQLSAKNIISRADLEKVREDIIFKWNTDTLFSEFKRLDTISERLEMLDKIYSHIGRLFSLNYVRHDILNMTDEEIEVMKKEIEEEKEEYIEMGIYPPEEQENNFGDYNDGFNNNNEKSWLSKEKNKENGVNIPKEPSVPKA